MKIFYRTLTAIICVALVSAAIYWRLISMNFGIGIAEGSIVFLVCQSMDNISHGAIVFYGILAIQVLVMHSLWAAVGFFFSPFLAFGTYLLILSIVKREPKSEGWQMTPLPNFLRASVGKAFEF